MTPSLRRFVAELPDSPGVYRMLDASGTVLYVGKAVHLKKRVSSYFKGHSTPKRAALLEKIASIDVTVTASETEALLLEMRLIKSLSPKYNVLLRDDKSFPWLYISSHPYPRIDSMRFKQKPKHGTYFGPYPSAFAVSETLNLIQDLFKLRNCKDSFFAHRSRPCLQYQLGRCTAPCTRLVTKEEYDAQVQLATRFLRGEVQEVMNDFSKRIEDAISRLAFEEAKTLHDTLKSLRVISEKQAMVEPGQSDVDVIVYQAKPGFGAISHAKIRNGEMGLNESFFPEVPKDFAFDDQSALEEAVLETFLVFYYNDNRHPIPPTILLDNMPENKEILEAMLRGDQKKRCRIIANPRGVKKRWLDFAKTNLAHAIEMYHRKLDNLSNRYQDLEKVLLLPFQIERMECFDISHHQGKATAASMVVFGKEGPEKKNYRHFHLNLENPGDDLLAMKETLSRRFSSIPIKPDLLIVDGGKGQVSAAKKVLDALGLHDLKLIGITKDPSRKSGLEHLIIGWENFREIYLPEDSLGLQLLLFIRDESHRFALKAHRKRYKKEFFHSPLEEIPGIGPKKRKALLLQFGGRVALSRASVEEIARVPGISLILAERIHAFFHP